MATYNGYNLSPAPVNNSGAFGQNVGQVGAPPSIWDQLNSNVPNYGALTSSATGDISSLLAGKLSPQTQNNIWNSAAARGVSLGQPNSPLSNEIGLSLTGNTTEGLQQQGLTDYNNFSSTVGSQQQNPALLADIAQGNAINAAAPNPSDAASYALSLFQKYMNPSSGQTSFNLNPSGGGGNAYSSFQYDGNPPPGLYQSDVAQNEGYGQSPYQVYNLGGY